MKNYVFLLEVVHTDDNIPEVTILRGTSGQVIDVCQDINVSVDSFIHKINEKK